MSDYLKVECIQNQFLTLLCADCHGIFHKNSGACQGWE